MRRVLILGGTAEARALAAELAARPGLRVVSSLAGRVSNPRLPVGEVREGGFGGAGGLAAYLAGERIDALVDATHPFAERMTASAAAASSATGVPLLVLRRPGWREGPGDAWQRVPSLHDAAALLPTAAWPAAAPTTAAPATSAAPLSTTAAAPGTAGSASSTAAPGTAGAAPSTAGPASSTAGPARGRAGGVRAAEARVFLTTGRRSLPLFTGLPGVWLLARSVDPPEPPVPPHVHVLLGRGPYTVEGERALIREHRLNVLVTKDSGGQLTAAKLTAARELGLPVIMVDRPPLPPGVRLVDTVAAATAWAAAQG